MVMEDVIRNKNRKEKKGRKEGARRRRDRKRV